MSNKGTWSWYESRREFLCKHGVGHYPVWEGGGRVHGCDGCCSHPSFPGRAPKAGDLAINHWGTLGFITRKRPVANTGWDGVEALSVRFRRSLKPNWSCIEPCVLASFEEVKEALQKRGESTKEFLAGRIVDGWSYRHLGITSQQMNSNMLESIRDIEEAANCQTGVRILLEGLGRINNLSPSERLIADDLLDANIHRFDFEHALWVVTTASGLQK